MAISTPAQKPRGAASSTLSTAISQGYGSHLTRMAVWQRWAVGCAAGCVLWSLAVAVARRPRRPDRVPRGARVGAPPAPGHRAGRRLRAPDLRTRVSSDQKGERSRPVGLSAMSLPRIVAVAPGSPADRAGLVPG